jgi:hypothetical protein
MWTLSIRTISISCVVRYLLCYVALVTRIASEIPLRKVGGKVLESRACVVL